MNLQAVQSVALSGMQSATQRLGQAAARVAAFGTTDAGEADAGSLAGHIVAERVALYDFKASMQVFRAQQEMLGSLLDICA